VKGFGDRLVNVKLHVDVAAYTEFHRFSVCKNWAAWESNAVLQEGSSDLY